MTLSSVVLPEPFGPDETDDLALAEGEIDVVDGRQALEAHDDSGGRKQHRRRAMRGAGPGPPRRLQHAAYFTAGNFSGNPTDSTTNFRLAVSNVTTA